jgi:peptide/nickel transport system substrate-binding protein
MITRSRLATLGLLLLAGCAGEAPCPKCDVIVVAAVSEPRSLLPPLVTETVGRDISDQVFERLADLAPGGAPIDPSAYRPRLADRWEQVDSLSVRLHLRPGARWHDGQPVTAEDVVFSFAAFRDSLLDPPARTSLERIAEVTAEDPATVLVRFRAAYPEQLYDATWHVRIIPAHVWGSLPKEGWAADTALAKLVGSGPYQVARWDRGQSLTLEAVPGDGQRTRIRNAVWRFAADPEAALNLILSREADLLETLGSPDRAARIESDTGLAAVPYPAAVYGFLGYQLGGQAARTPVGDRLVRRALNMAVDRAAVATAAYGPGSKAPPGPMSQLQWLWDDSIAVLPFDTLAAARLLDEAGWARGTDGTRRKAGRPLRVDVLVPSTSIGRRRIAEIVQDRWGRVGVTATITAVDFPVFMERLGQGRFETYIGAWLDEPSPRGLADQWTSAGIGRLNYGRYASPAFDRLLDEALATRDPGAARRTFRAAFDTLNADAPAMFLYAPVNLAAVSRRVEGLVIDPFSWISGLPAASLIR